MLQPMQLYLRYHHCFMGITEQGIPAICNTTGNPNCHIILRGGKSGTNFSVNDIYKTNVAMQTKMSNHQ